MTTVAGRFTFQVTQPPGHKPPVAEGQCTNFDDAMREAGHYHRIYAQDGRTRVEVYEDRGGGRRILHLMATAGKEQA
jgi:hypothetical protein